MGKYKNVILILLSIVLLVYAGFISIFPKMATSMFNLEKFEQECFDATSLKTTLGSINYKISPNFSTVITITDFDVKYVDDQDLFNAGSILIKTTPSAIFGGNFDIKSMELKNVTYVDQVLPNKQNKLSYLPEGFNSKPFGKNWITIHPGPVNVKGLHIKYVGPNSFSENKFREKNYTKSEVKDFLSSYTYSHIRIK